jgi:hypothetical protein
MKPQIKNFGTCLTHFSPNTCHKICRFNLSGGILTRHSGSQEISDAKKQHYRYPFIKKNNARFRKSATFSFELKNFKPPNSLS